MYNSLVTAFERIRSRLKVGAPEAVGLAVAALIIVELMHLALTWSTDGRLRPPASQPEVHTAKSGVDIQTIVAAHLFGIAVAGPSTREPGDAPATTANLVLAGTLATQDPRRGFAIITGAGPSKVYSVGEDVGGASLYSVYADRVILDRGGSFETLPLRRSLLAGRALQSGNVPLPPRSLGVFVDSLGRAVDKEPGVLDKMMRMVDTYDDNQAKMRGFRVYPVANGKSFRIMGLSPGDLLTSINGEALDDLSRGREILNSVKRSDQPTVTVERQGQTLNLTLNVSSAAADTDNAPAVAALGPEETSTAE